MKRKLVFEDKEPPKKVKKVIHKFPEKKLVYDFPKKECYSYDEVVQIIASEYRKFEIHMSNFIQQPQTSFEYEYIS